MTTYLFPIKMAILFFPILALLATIPFAIYNYRKYGYVNKMRLLISFSLIFYLISAYYLVILPLPENRDVRSMQSEDIEHYNLRPLRFIGDIARESQVDFSSPASYKYLLRERAFLQVIFNVFLLLPLGVYLRYYFRRDFKESLVISLSVSLFFELTQLSALYGFYNAPYRIFDVDDLFLNTLGGCLGYFIAPVLTFFLPAPEALDEGVDLASLRVGYLRRAIVFLVDTGLVSFIVDLVPGLAYKGLLVFLYFIVLPYATNGRTLGHRLTMTRIRGRSDRLGFLEILGRNGILFLLIPAINIFLTSIIEANLYTDYYFVSGIFSIIHILYMIFLFGHFLYSLLKREDFFYEKISHTRLVIEAENFQEPGQAGQEEGLEAGKKTKRKRKKTMEIRRARREDLDEVMDIIGEAQAYFKDQAIPQWQNNYPNRESILKDMELESYYIMEEDGRILAGMAALEGREITYGEIFQGQWLTEGDSYMTFHRVAVAQDQKGRGLAGQLLAFGEDLARTRGLKSLRIDTHRSNQSMRRLVEKNGFNYCGLVYMLDGGERLAFEKLLEY